MTKAKLTLILCGNGWQDHRIQKTSIFPILKACRLHKSGQDGVDQDAVNKIIYKASEGSKYFENEKRKDAELSAKIESTLKKLNELRCLDLSSDLKRLDEKIALQEATRDLTQVIVHVDCDAFYASVEELDRPELKNVPMGVGMGVLTTANYAARQSIAGLYQCANLTRKFGVRSAMPVYAITFFLRKL